MGRRRRTALIAAIILASSTAGLALSRSSRFDARRINVSGLDRLGRSQVMRIAEISRGTNVLWLDEGQAERRLESDKWIARADVHASFPLTIDISITERTPVARIGRDVGDLVAGDGTVLGPGGFPTRLPIIEAGAPGWVEGVRPSPVGAARALGAMDSALRAQVGSVRVLLDGTLELRLRGGPVVRFGTPDQARRKARMIRWMLAWAAGEQAEIRVLSVVAPFAPSVTLAT